MITRSVSNATAGSFSTVLTLEPNTTMRQLVVPKQWFLDHSTERESGYTPLNQSNDSLGDPIVAGNYVTIVATTDGDDWFYPEAVCYEDEVAEL